MAEPITVLRLTDDLRLADQAALCAAAARGCVLPVYILDDRHGIGGAAAWALRESLASLARAFKAKGVELILRRGDPTVVLPKVAAECGATHIDWSRRYAPADAVFDERLAADLTAAGYCVTVHDGFLLFDPRALRTGTGSFYKVFTPFSKACFAAPPPAPPVPAPARIKAGPPVGSLSLAELSLVPAKARWPQGLADAWRMDEDAAHALLRAFLADKLAGYKTLRDRPDLDATSRLSPYLRFGLISPRQVWHAAMRKTGAEKFLSEVLWREFSWHLLGNIPDFTEQPWQKSFAAFPWRADAPALAAWQRGRTGYPIVDAAMRQLWQTGWMHNRARMIVASFLVKDLLIDWREGAAWFMDTLIDADIGNNTAGWQWVAGCGADAAPYFRVFNPVLQGQKFDPDGAYVRRFVPELAKLPMAFIHEPWKAPAAVLAQAGIRLGDTYPVPLIDHGFARKRALAALKNSKLTEDSPGYSGDLFK